MNGRIPATNTVMLGAAIMCEYCGNPTFGMDCMDCHCAVCASCLLGELCPNCAADNW